MKERKNKKPFSKIYKQVLFFCAVVGYFFYRVAPETGLAVVIPVGMFAMVAGVILIESVTGIQYEDTSPKGLLAGLALAAFTIGAMYLANPEATRYFWGTGLTALAKLALLAVEMVVRLIKLLFTGSPD